MGARNILRRIPMASSIRRAAGKGRHHYLGLRYPNGRLATCVGIPVWCDYRDPTAQWYESDSTNLRLDLEFLHEVAPDIGGEVILDVGAHFGFFSAAFRTIFPRHRIVSLEPDRFSYRCIEQTARAVGGIEPLRVALASFDGEVELFSGSDCRHTYPSRGDVIVDRVPARSLDSLSEEIGAAIGLIKIDVDGAEGALFEGGGKTLTRDRPKILMEFAPDALDAAGTDPRALLRFLGERYEMTLISYGGIPPRKIQGDDFASVVEQIGDSIGDIFLIPRR